jgi:hypothetical protein
LHESYEAANRTVETLKYTPHLLPVSIQATAWWRSPHLKLPPQWRNDSGPVICLFRFGNAPADLFIGEIRYRPIELARLEHAVEPPTAIVTHAAQPADAKPAEVPEFNCQRAGSPATS